MAGRFSKAPAGICAFSCETKRDSTKGGGRPAAPPGPGERALPCISRSAAVYPCPAGTSKHLTPFIFLKREGGPGKNTQATSKSSGRNAHLLGKKIPVIEEGPAQAFRKAEDGREGFPGSFFQSRPS